MTDYARECTIRGLVNVSQDIHILPGDRLRFDENGDGSYRIVVLKGELWLQKFTKLVEKPGKNPVIDPLPGLTSFNLSDDHAYWEAIRVFKDNDLNSVRRLQEKQGAETISIVAATTNDGRELMILNITTNPAPAQNGTGHGDWT